MRESGYYLVRFQTTPNIWEPAEYNAEDNEWGWKAIGCDYPFSDEHLVEIGERLVIPTVSLIER